MRGRQYRKSSIKKDSDGEDWMELDWTLQLKSSSHRIQSTDDDSLPATGLSVLHLSMLPTTLASSKIDYTLLDPRVCPTCFRSQSWSLMCLSAFACTSTSCSSSRMHTLCTAVTTYFCPRKQSVRGNSRGNIHF